MTMPPSIVMTCPVMYAAAGSSARNFTSPATSSASPKRPSGIACSTFSPMLSLKTEVMSDLMYPGATARAGAQVESPVCVVTGASRGIGRAIALALGQAGAKVRMLPTESPLNLVCDMLTSWRD